MMLRHDGRFGSFGGIIEDGEDVAVGVNRETEEEIGVDLGVTKEDFICGHVVNHPFRGELELHAFAKEISKEKFCQIEKDAHKAVEFGKEVK